MLYLVVVDYVIVSNPRGILFHQTVEGDVRDIPEVIHYRAQ